MNHQKRKNMKKYKFLTVLVIALLSNLSYIQSQSCPNINFSQGNFTNWQCYLGSCSNGTIINKSAHTPGRHSIMDAALLTLTNQMQDENCPAIPKVPVGFAYSARVGNSEIGAEMEAIEYTLTVDSSNSLLIVHFAWILEATEHAPEEQPKFSIIIRDTNNIPISNLPCGNVDFVASQDLDSLTCQTQTLLARNWTTVGYSLEHLMGQTIKIYFETRDCTESGHFGYAYVVAECRPSTIELMYCINGASRLRAPEGFAWYKWTRSSDSAWVIEGAGSQYQNLVLANPNNNEIFSCEVTSKLDSTCSATLNTKIIKTSVDVSFKYGIMEDGGVDLESNNNQNWYDTCSRTATFVDLSTVTNSTKSSISWEIQGLNVTSTDSLFTYTFPNPIDDSVTYLIQLSVYAENGCADRSYAYEDYYITIYQSPRIEIVGETKLCEGTGLKAVARKSEFVNYEWTDNTGTILGTGDSITIDNIGTYYLITEDIAGCFAKDSIIIIHPVLTMDASVINVECYGFATGAIIHGPISGGLSPYFSIQWFYINHDGNKSLFKENGHWMGETFLNLAAGLYIVEVLDAKGCILIDTIEVLQPDSLQIIGTYDSPTNGLDNGKIEISAIGGKPPYKYRIEKSEGTVVSNTNSASNLSGGSYVISVTDSNGCVTVDALIVKPLTANLDISIENVDCYGNATGMFEYGAISGGEEPYSSMQWFYIDLDGNKSFFKQGDQQGASYQNLSAGIYLFEAIDAKGDTLAKGVQINQPDSIKIIEIQYLNDGKIKIIAIGGTAPYSFQIETLSEIITVTSDSVFYLDKGSYAVIITDANDCITFDSIVVEENVSIKNLVFSSFSVGQNIPNPANNTTLIPFSLPENGNVVFELFSISGQLLHKETISLPKGDNYIEYNTFALPSGIYFYSVSYNNQRLTKKMVVKK